MPNDFRTPLVRRRTLIGSALPAIAATVLYPTLSAAKENSMNPFAELFETSQTEKKGLTFYVGGATIAGIVAKVNGADSVEVRNQMHSRIVIRLDRVDAVAIS